MVELIVMLLCTHTLGGVGWEPPPRGPRWDLPATARAGRCKVFP